jgi:hypothetical protein
LRKRDVASWYYDELESELQGAQPLSLDEKCKKLEETIHRVATNAPSATRENKQIKSGCANGPNPNEREAFVQKKARQLDEKASIDLTSV